jgi:hypothetical protein
MPAPKRTAPENPDFQRKRQFALDRIKAAGAPNSAMSCLLADSASGREGL